MSGLQWMLGVIGDLQILVLLVILFWRGHHRRLPLFTIYVAGVVFSEIALVLDYRIQTWMVRQVIVAALRFGVTLELTYAIFRAFPAAAATARKVFLVLLVLTALTAMSATGPETGYPVFALEVVPRLATGTVWILTALAALVLWYRLPLGTLQRAILVGLAPYLIVFTLGLDLLAKGWRYRDVVGYIGAFAMLAMINYWCRVAWRTAPESETRFAPTPIPRAAS
jgi:hypothetical protein